MLKACLNGGVGRAQSRHVPVTAEDLAADAVRCRAAGAHAVHVHPRGPDGAESLSAAAIGAAVAAIRRAAPGLPVGVSTGAWIVPDAAARVAAVRSWADLPPAVRPDFASVNVHEEAAEAVATALYGGGIGVEAGIWRPAAVPAYRAWPVPCLRVLVELVDQPYADGGKPRSALDAAAELLGLLAGERRPVLLHAAGAATWPVLGEAVRRGLDTRIGIEDCATLPDGSMTGNAELVAHAVTLGAR